MNPYPDNCTPADIDGEYDPLFDYWPDYEDDTDSDEEDITKLTLIF